MEERFPIPQPAEYPDTGNNPGGGTGGGLDITRNVEQATQNPHPSMAEMIFQLLPPGIRQEYAFPGAKNFQQQLERGKIIVGFGNILKQTRELMGFSVDEMASHFSVQKVSYWNTEKRDSNRTVSTVGKFAQPNKQNGIRFDKNTALMLLVGALTDAQLTKTFSDNQPGILARLGEFEKQWNRSIAIPTLSTNFPRINKYEKIAYKNSLVDLLRALAEPNTLTHQNGSFAEVLKEIMDTRHMDQADLAKISGLSPRAISFFLDGTVVNPKMHTLATFHTVLRLNQDEAMLLLAAALKENEGESNTSTTNPDSVEISEPILPDDDGPADATEVDDED